MTHSSADGKNTEKNAAKSCLRSRLDHAIETVEKKYGISYVPQGALTLSDFSDVGAHLFRIPQAQACSRDELGSLVEDIRNICGTVVDGRRKKRDEFNKLKTLTQVCVMRRMGAVPFSDEGRLADDFIQKCADKLESGEILRPDDDSFSRNIRWTHFLVHEYLDNDGIFECFNPPTVQAKEARKRKAGKGTNEAPVAHLTPGGLKCLQAAFADLAAERLEDVERFLADMDLSTGGAVLDKLPQAVEHFLKTAGPDTFGGDYQAGPPVHEMHLQVEEDRRAVIVALEDAFNALEIALSLRAYESRPPEKKKNRDTGEFDPYAVGDISVPDNDATNRKSDELHTGILRHYPLWRGHYMADKLVKKWCPKEELRSLANWQNTQARHNSDRREVLFRRAVTAAAIDIWQQDVNVPLGEVAERVAEFFEKDEGRGVDASFGRFLREYSAKFRCESLALLVVPDRSQEAPAEWKDANELMGIAAEFGGMLDCGIAETVTGVFRKTRRDTGPYSNNRVSRVARVLERRTSDPQPELQTELVTVLEYLAELAPEKVPRRGARAVFAPPAYVSDILRHDGIPMLFPFWRKEFLCRKIQWARILAITASHLTASGNAGDTEKLLNAALLEKGFDDYHTTFNECVSAAMNQCPGAAEEGEAALTGGGEESDIASMILNWAKKLAEGEIDPAFWGGQRGAAVQDGTPPPRVAGPSVKCSDEVARLRASALFLIEEGFALFLEDVAAAADSQLVLLRPMISDGKWPSRRGRTGGRTTASPSETHGDQGTPSTS